MKRFNNILAFLVNVTVLVTFILQYKLEINMPILLQSVLLSISINSIFIYLYRLMFFKPIIDNVISIMNLRIEIILELQKEEKIILERKLEYFSNILVKNNITDNTGKILRTDNEVDKHIQILKEKYDRVNEIIDKTNKLL